MSRRNLRPITLRLALLFCLAAVLVWVVWLLRIPPEAVVPASSLGPIALGPAVRFTFAGGSDSITVAAVGEEYWIRHPLHDRADLFFITEVQRRLVNLQAERILPDTAGAGFGLSPGRHRLTVWDGTGRRWQIALGDSSPVGSQIYARTSGQPHAIALIDRFTARKYFAPDLTALRDHVTTPMHPGPVDSVVILTPGERLSSRRVSSEIWMTPAGRKVDAARINRVLQSWRSQELTGFPDPGLPLRALGLSPPRATWICYQSGVADTVRVGNPTRDQREVFLLPSGRRLPAQMSGEFFRSMIGGYAELGDRHLLSVPPESVGVIEFLDLEEKESYVYRGRHWSRLPADHVVPNTDRLDQDLRNLAALQYRRYPESVIRPPTSGRIRLRLSTISAAETLLAAPRDSTGWARSSHSPRWGEVTPLAWNTWQYRAGHRE